ncbi:hypothetical protein [Persicitalea jodogahamensis]|uniref:Uncharacterized protein n=1 Tax=Persicitalea jodogahamensis TaxID=402147 RepID=A0A8J3GAN0_9BACT|nr:hypothetical protein [Persicitalea jodogahamensis]GHB84213.1 hypothetical protein GCM10007390_44290 [Persicitalea jodogahamensis]
MSINKVDVSVNYYGKPYQTIVTLLTLWKHSRQHIGTIYLVIEKNQPYQQYGGVKLLQWALKQLPVEYYYPVHFYYHGSPPIDSLGDRDTRYGLKYQYGLENTDKKFHFLSHNDCLYQADLLGMMLEQVNDAEEEIAGVGMIGQCWNCPALAAQKCDGSRFEQFQPKPQEYRDLLNKYLNVISLPPAREAIHYNLIEKGQTYPLPECRLNEYACLINTELYQKLAYPKGKMLPLGAAWHGTDWGTVWFYEMVNSGYKFLHFPFDPHMVHAPFTPAKSGHVSDNNPEEYSKTEENAHQFLQKDFPELAYIPSMVRFSIALNKPWTIIRRFFEKAKARLSFFVQSPR